MKSSRPQDKLHAIKDYFEMGEASIKFSASATQKPAMCWRWHQRRKFAPKSRHRCCAQLLLVLYAAHSKGRQHGDIARCVLERAP